MADRAGQPEPALSDLLLRSGTFERVVADCRALVAAEVARNGWVVRSAFGLAQRARPDLVERALRALIPDFARELDRFHADWRAAGRGSFADYILAREETVTQALLQVSDRRVAAVRSRAVRTGYDRLRPRAAAEVRAALPAVAAAVTRHVESAA